MPSTSGPCFLFSPICRYGKILEMASKLLPQTSNMKLSPMTMSSQCEARSNTWSSLYRHKKEAAALFVGLPSTLAIFFGQINRHKSRNGCLHHIPTFVQDEYSQQANHGSCGPGSGCHSQHRRQQRVSHLQRCTSTSMIGKSLT